VNSSTDSGGVGARGARARPLPDGLKTKSVLMKTTEPQMLWKPVKFAEPWPLAAAELRLLMGVLSDLLDFEAESKLKHQGFERPCR
jgi:hypothetical protein